VNMFTLLFVSFAKNLNIFLLLENRLVFVQRELIVGERTQTRTKLLDAETFYIYFAPGSKFGLVYFKLPSQRESTMTFRQNILSSPIQIVMFQRWLQYSECS
jgi:hypothetical protein